MIFIVTVLTLVVVCLGTLIVFIDFHSKKVDNSIPFAQAAKMYIFKKLLTLFGKYRQNKLVQNSKNVMKIQEKFLFDQLALNVGTEYGKKYNFSKVSSVEDYKSLHPLTRYDHYKPYVERMMKGETKILTSNQPVIFAVTSGTSGNSNIIPMVKRQQTLFFLDGISLLFHLMTEFFPKSARFQKHLKFFYDPIKWRESDRVKEGESYELVITNPTCLYRYRFGDVVRIKQFYNQCPVVEFLYRQGQFLSVRGEKTSEAVFYKVLNETVESSQGIELVDYCCCESILVPDQLNTPISGNTSPSPCYHVFIEFKSNTPLTEQQCHQLAQQLDDNLIAISYVYSSFRKKGSIGPIRIHCVQDGSFYNLRNFFLENTSASFNQYKVPRVLKTKDSVDFISKHIE